MERSARQMLLFSFGSFVLVLAFGSVRAMGPLRHVLDTPASTKSLQAFHSHFDQLCWLGSAALGATMWILRDAWRGPRWVPPTFNACWFAGSVLFATSFFVRGVGEALSRPALARGAYALLVSAGGSLFFPVMALGAWIALGAVRAPSAARAPAAQR
jgi:hypothetical protein